MTLSVLSRSAFLSALLVSLATPLTATSATYEAFPWYGENWPHTRSAYAHASDLVLGTLPNGMRYCLVPSKKTPGQIILRLDVQAGAYMEKADEEGLAHYLEHMAFNGSEHLATGTLKDFFLSHGMRWGRDANASTNSRGTLYKINLAHGEKDLDTAFLVLRDWATGLTLPADQVEKERGIILAEKRERESDRTRRRDGFNALLYSDARARTTIGTESTLQGITQAKLKAFYDTWYRPERFTLVVVGDLNVPRVKADIEKTFSTLKAKTPLPQRVTFTAPEPNVRVGLTSLYDHGTSSVTVMLKPMRGPVTDDRDRTRHHALERFADEVLFLSLLNEKKRHPEWTKANALVRATDLLRPELRLNVITTPKATLKSVRDVGALLDALQTGMSEADFARIKAELLTRYTNTCEGPQPALKGFHNDKAAERIIDALRNNEVLVAPCVRTRLEKEAVEALTLTDVNDYLKALFSTPSVTLDVASHQLPTVREVKKAWLSRLSQKGVVNLSVPTVEKKTKPKEITFPVLPDPEDRPMPTVSTETLKVKGIVGKKETVTLFTTTLDNGLTVNLVPGSQRVSMTLRLGSGCNDPVTPVASLTALNEMLSRTGIGPLTRKEAKTLLRDHTVTLRQSMDTRGLSLHIEGRQSDVPFMLEVLRTQWVQPHYSMTQLTDVLTQLRQVETEPAKSVDEALGRHWWTFVTNLSDKNAKALTPTDLAACLKDAHLSQNRALIVTGGDDPEGLLSDINRVLGGVPDGSVSTTTPALGMDLRAGHKEQIVVNQVSDKKAIVNVVWALRAHLPHGITREASNTNLFWDTHMLRVLGKLFRSALVDTLREEDSLIYSPKVEVKPLDLADGFTTFSVRVNCDPKAVDRVIAGINAIAQAWEREGLDATRLAQHRASIVYTAPKRESLTRLHDLLEREATLNTDQVVHWVNRHHYDEAITPEGLKDLVHRLFKNPPATLVVIPASAQN